MPTRSYYLRQAELLRSLAATAGDEELRQQHLRRANEYVVLAMSLPEDAHISPAPPTLKPEQPAAAQQQQQVQPDQSENKE